MPMFMHIGSAATSAADFDRTDGATANPGGSSHTFTGMNIGDEHADRVIFVLFAWNGNSLAVNSLTVDGVAAQMAVSNSVSYGGASVWRVRLPTNGTTADIAVSMSGSMDYASIVVVRSIYYSTYRWGSAGATGTLGISVDVDAPDGGLVLANARLPSLSSWSWTAGVDDLADGTGSKSGGRKAISRDATYTVSGTRSPIQSSIIEAATFLPNTTPSPRGSTPPAYVTATSASAAVPGDAVIGDLLIAAVMHRDTITSAPSGWTLVDTQSCSATGFPSHVLSVYKKIAVSGDLGGTPSWAQNSSQRMAVTISAWRSRSGPLDVKATAKTARNSSTTTSNVYGLANLSATADYDVLVAFTTSILSQPSPTVTPFTLPSGWSNLGVLSVADNRLAALYRTVMSGESTSGLSVSSDISPSSNNGVASVTLRLGLA